MKKSFLTLAVATLFASCTTTPVDKNAETSHRIVGKEHNVYDGVSYQIIEVDGVEYLCAYQGGMCPLVKDTIK
jgi:hypothetical protein